MGVWPNRGFMVLKLRGGGQFQVRKAGMVIQFQELVGNYYYYLNK